VVLPAQLPLDADHRHRDPGVAARRDRGCTSSATRSTRCRCSALLLLIGVVVDDAIVVLENIYRHRGGPDPTRTAAIEGTEEVGFAVIAASLTLVSIFGSVLFLEGIVGASSSRSRWWSPSACWCRCSSRSP
jgi:hypothetical protein